jgi:hypothetical protein
VWNYLLGGTDNYPVDRDVGDRITAMYPGIGEIARADRGFLGRAVRHLAGTEGVRQFLDLGTGLPSAEHTHEVAQRVAPDARIVYVDNDPTVLAHSRTLLTSSPAGQTEYLDADVREPETIIPRLGRTLDLRRPVAVMMVGILNFVQDTEEARGLVRRYLDAVVPGSFLVLSHPTLEPGVPAHAEIIAFWNEHATPPVRARTVDEIASFVEGLDVLPPGIVSSSRWRPDPGSDPGPEVTQRGLLARKP